MTIFLKQNMYTHDIIVEKITKHHIYYWSGGLKMRLLGVRLVRV